MANKKNFTKNAKFFVPGEGIGNLSMRFADLVDEREAMALAKHIAAQAGQTVTVRRPRQCARKNPGNDKKLSEAMRS